MEELVDVLKILDSKNLIELISEDIKKDIINNKCDANYFFHTYYDNLNNKKIYKKLDIVSLKFSDLEEIDKNKIFVYTYIMIQPSYLS
jgi:hypothetical protein